MRIAVTGAACTGKSTFIQDFINNWDTYTTPEKTYRDLFNKRTRHSDKTTKTTQKKVLDFMIDQHMQYTKDDNILFDRCPIDNIVYSLYAYDKQTSNIDEDFIGDCIPMVRECMKFIDVIFYLPYIPGQIDIEDKQYRVTDESYIQEIDNLLAQIEQQSFGSSPFFPAEDRPVMIRLTGDNRQRIKQASMYVNDDGDSYEEGESEIDWEQLSQFGIEPRDVFPDGVIK